LKNQEITIKAKGMPTNPALAARERRAAKTMRTVAAPPRVGRRRWARILRRGVITQTR
jgi:hypothetical protein